MKRVKAMVLALAALSVAPAISASDASQPYNRVTAMYSNRSYGDLSTNGFEIGYVHGFSLTDKLPLFFQTGVKMDMGFKGYSGSDMWDNDFVKADLNLTTMSFSVPLDLAYNIAIGGVSGVSISPYIGLNAKLNALADVKAKATVGSQSASQTESLFDNGMRRFQLGWHIGAGLNIDCLYIGLQYGTDSIAVAEDGNHTPTVSVGVGYNF